MAVGEPVVLVGTSRVDLKKTCTLKLGSVELSIWLCYQSTFFSYQQNNKSVHFGLVQGQPSLKKQLGDHNK